MSQDFRAPSGGRIDRTRLLNFRFDGQPYQGHPGDTLASALLANGVRLVGRSFKYHRPRGLYAAGAEEPNGLCELRSGARREPNTRMTLAELFDGLEASSQNRWPSLRFDIRSLAGLVSPALAAGFYYKTFMWPPSWWEKVYEPAIRRAAGLGRAPRVADPDDYEAAHAHCDVAVVGAGPAGLSAALAAGAAGARVILCEQDFALGGWLLSEPAQDVWFGHVIAQFAALSNVTLMPRTTVFGYYDGNMLGAVERVADHLPEPPPFVPRQRYWTIRAREVVLATGAHERIIAFPGNDRPGAMLAGAAATYARRFAALPGRRVVAFANNDQAYDALFALQECGLGVVAAIDPRADSPAMAAAAARGIRVLAGSEIAGTLGSASVTGAKIRRRGTTGSETNLEADVLLVSGGFNPAVHLASQSRTPLIWNDSAATFVPGAPVQPQRSAGAAAGIFGLAAASRDGARVGAEAAAACGFPGTPNIPVLAATDADPALVPLWEVKASGKAFVDIQDDVTTEDIRLAHREGYRHIEHAKRYTTHAMGTDQGKIGGLVGAAVLAEARGEPIAAVGLPNFRPYTTPVTWGAIAGHHVGKDFAPIRRGPLHDWHIRHGAEMIETGLWLRPSLYPARGDSDAWSSILREARTVRGAVGVCDVSTLGKIDVQGPDAAHFLDRIYCNAVSTLPVGRARYGLMLREDGIAFDDGTTSRLAADHFLVTTTTANAGPVMEHMEFYLQTVWPDLDVQIASVTDAWAGMSVAGPRARDLLAGIVTGLDLGNDAFPFMAVGAGEVGGCPVRVARISFSGELAYELMTPAGFAETAWQAVIDAGAPFGLAPYGLEALNLLRIEKGHVAGAELNGQTTAADLGLARMMRKRGDFIGRALATRPGLTDPARPRLVGVRAHAPLQEIRAGAHLVAPGTTLSLGHVTSVTRSVELDCWIGLALLADGESRIGTRLHAAYPLKDSVVEVEITPPHFVDPENARVRA